MQIFVKSIKFLTKRYAGWWQCCLTQDSSRQKKGRLSVVCFGQAEPGSGSEHNLKEPNIPIMTDILKTAEILYYPFICHGISLCDKYDWDIPEKIVRQLNPEIPELLEKLQTDLALLSPDARTSSAFISLMLLVFWGVDYRENNLHSRIVYQKTLIDFIQKSRVAAPESEAIKDFLAYIHFITISREDFSMFRSC